MRRSHIVPERESKHPIEVIDKSEAFLFVERQNHLGIGHRLERNTQPSKGLCGFQSHRTATVGDTRLTTVPYFGAPRAVYLEWSRRCKATQRFALNGTARVIWPSMREGISHMNEALLRDQLSVTNITNKAAHSSSGSVPLNHVEKHALILIDCDLMAMHNLDIPPAVTPEFDRCLAILVERANSLGKRCGIFGPDD